MLKPLNHQERKTAAWKFGVTSVIALLFIPAITLIYDQVPETLPASGKQSFSTDTTDRTMTQDIQQKLNLAVRHQSNINMMLLMDATPGMEAFIPAVADAADAINQSYALNMTAACYRDASEGQWLYLSSDKTGQPPSEWLRDLSTSALYDQDEPEAVFYALKEALQSDHLKRGESNILILVGDAGNHAQEPITQVAPSEIVDLLIEKNCYFAAFQTRNPASDPAFGQFPEQIRNEIMLPALQGYQKEKGERLFNTQKDATGTSFYSNDALYYYLYAVQPNQALSPESLKSKIISFADSTIQATYHKIRTIRNLQEGRSISEKDDYRQTILPLLEFYGISRQDLQQLYSSDKKE